jgi:hypothetical protein
MAPEACNPAPSGAGMNITQASLSRLLLGSSRYLSAQRHSGSPTGSCTGASTGQEPRFRIRVPPAASRQRTALRDHGACGPGMTMTELSTKERRRVARAACADNGEVHHATVHPLGRRQSVLAGSRRAARRAAVPIAPFQSSSLVTSRCWKTGSGSPPADLGGQFPVRARRGCRR